MTTTFVFIGIALILLVFVVLAAWGVIYWRNRGLFGDAPGDEFNPKWRDEE